MRDLISMATQTNEILDCRCLKLQLSYYELDRSLVSALSTRCYEHMQAFLGDSFVTEWFWNERKIKQSNVRLKLNSGYGINFSMQGNIISDRVYNKTTLKQYRHSFIYEDLPTHSMEVNVASDYLETFDSLYSDATTPEDIKAATLKLFNLEHRKALAKWRGFDAHGRFFSHTAAYDHSLVSGKYELQVAIACLGTHAEEVSEHFASFLEQIASTFPGISGHVSLTPHLGLGHRGYFFSGKPTLPSELQGKEIYSNEWMEYYYVQDVTWLNVLSPLQRRHVPTLSVDAKNTDGVSLKDLNGGGVAVYANKLITRTDMAEYAALKRLLYNALFPGSCKIQYIHLLDRKLLSPMAKPRLRWEYIPVFEDEIVALEDGLVLRHKNFQESI